MAKAGKADNTGTLSIIIGIILIAIMLKYSREGFVSSDLNTMYGVIVTNVPPTLPPIPSSSSSMLSSYGVNVSLYNYDTGALLGSTSAGTFPTTLGGTSTTKYLLWSCPPSIAISNTLLSMGMTMFNQQITAQGVTAGPAQPQLVGVVYEKGGSFYIMDKNQATSNFTLFTGCSGNMPTKASSGSSASFPTWGYFAIGGGVILLGVIGYIAFGSDSRSNNGYRGMP